jgi:hypothetical protein
VQFYQQRGEPVSGLCGDRRAQIELKGSGGSDVHRERRNGSWHFAKSDAMDLLWLLMRVVTE